jgi:hypothetical protein
MPAGTAKPAAAASAASTTFLPVKYSFVCTFFQSTSLGLFANGYKTKFISRLF